MQTLGLPASFEGLNSSLAQLAGKLWSCKVMAKKWLEGKSNLALNVLTFQQ